MSETLSQRVSRGRAGVGAEAAGKDFVLSAAEAASSHRGRARGSAKMKDQQEMQKLQGIRVLVVEDEFLLAMDIESAIREAGGEVVGPVVSLEEAVATAKREELNAAVLDLNLRGEMSYPVAEILKSRHVPFLFATGYSQSRLPEPFQCRPCLRKPFTWVALTTALERLVAQAPGVQNPR
jgi:CheY-like chemotaxis protein